MLVYNEIQWHRRKFLALTGLTVAEFQQLLSVFTVAYNQFYASDLTLAGERRQRFVGGGRHSKLYSPEQKLLFILVYLKTYPLHVVMAELFGLSVTRVNYWIHHLLPVLREALDQLGVLPEREPDQLPWQPVAAGTERRLIIDGTDRRRQRPKNPEKQALHYSGRKKAHTDKNVVVVDTRSARIDFLSRTYAGTTNDKKIADKEQIVYPPGTVLYKDAGFQGYEPKVRQTRQAKKKATPRGAHGQREANQPKTGAYSRASGA
jgi:Helix-turn-helix of DDE superfamily endonuclease/DDE superfamily endonuclease